MLGRLCRPVPGVKGDIPMRFKIDDPSSEGPVRPSENRKTRTRTGVLTVRAIDGVLVAWFNDRSLRSMDTGKLRAEIAGLCRNGGPRVILLSMRNTETLSSSVLGAIAQLSTDLERAGGVLVLYKVPREIGRVLKKTRLDRLIHTAKDRDAARKRAESIVRRGGGDRRTDAA